MRFCFVFENATTHKHSTRAHETRQRANTNTNTHVQEGKKRGINVNCIAPGAGSRMTATIMPPEMVEVYKPDYVAPVTVWLCHESCEESGQIYEAGGGWVSKVKWQRSKGATFDVRESFTPEDVAGTCRMRRTTRGSSATSPSRR